MAIIIRRWSSTIFLACGIFFTLWYLSSLTYLSTPPSHSNIPPTANKAPRPGTDDFGGVSIHWRPIPKRYPIQKLQKLPSTPPQAFPPLQYAFGKESSSERTTREKRLATVKKSFVRTWDSYKALAWMQDELQPISGGSLSSFGGWAATLVDSLDTLWILGLKNEFEMAVEAAAGIDFTTTDTDMLNVFETTIRYLGGFLGAYDVSDGQYPVLLDKAKQLGEILYCAFDTANRMPVTRWYWKQALLRAQDPTEVSVIAEVGSLTLEFTRLAQLTGDHKYYDAVARVTTAFQQAQGSTSIPGLWPTVMNARTLSFTHNDFTFGGMADSLYEYLPKQYILLGGAVPNYQRMYDWAMLAAKRHLFFRPMVPSNADILISGNAHYNTELQAIEPEPQGQHLGCFTGGMVALGAKVFDRQEELAIARKLVDGCVWAYDNMVNGIMPETFHMVPCASQQSCTWNESLWHAAIEKYHPNASTAKNLIKDRRLRPGYAAMADRRYILRPEAFESIFVLYRLTGDRSLQDAAWRMFQAVEKHTKTELAYAALIDVTVTPPVKQDRMESFWTAETLKYLYLLYSEPNAVSLDKFVLWVFPSIVSELADCGISNTEAHPFKRPT